MAKRILVPIGRNEADRAVVSLVADMARTSGATVRLLHVAPVPKERIAENGRVVAYADQEMERIEFARRDDLRPAEAELEGVPVESVVRFGDRVEEILNEAEAFGADLIAVSGRRPGWGPRGLGGVVSPLMRRSPTPVLLLAAQ